jgi:sortase A
MSARSDTAAHMPIAEPRRRRFGRHPGRVLRIVGILCLLGAVGVGGYLAWLLWGTGLATARAQHELRPSFELKIDTKEPSDPAADRVRLPGTAVAIIKIPRIDLDMVVVEGTSTEDLKKGPGHYDGSAYPWQEGGKVAIAGHRTTYQHPFWSLDKLRPDHRIILETEYGTFTYRVTRSRVYPAATAGVVLEQTLRPTLVLTTCNPKFSAAERLIVFADRVETGGV